MKILKMRKDTPLMAYRYGNRNQLQLFPSSIEEYVTPDDPVRVYDAFIEALDLEKLGLYLDPHHVGNPAYHPKTMLKLLVYAYSYGIRSSRKIERATRHNLSFIWLTQGLRPDHKTIAEFRRKNRSQLADVLKQCAHLCIELNLIEGNTLFLDGSKIRANASIKKTWDQKKAQRALQHIDQRIAELLNECDEQDEAEEESGSFVKMDESLKDQKVLQAKIQRILAELEEKKQKSLNTTDPDCTRINSINGTHAGYNVQSVVDDQHGLILSVDVVSENNDYNQFAKQIDQANELLEQKCQVACADSGYASTTELAKIDQQGIKVIVPSQRQVSEKTPSPFAKEQFPYDHLHDRYICPEGHQLTFSYLNKNKKNGHKHYMISAKKICLSCSHYGVCTQSKQGRKIIRLVNEELREKFEAQYLEPESQAIYRRRKAKVELPFGHIKRNLGVNAFLLRGLQGVKAEASILGTCFNLVRMITILGVTTLVRLLQEIKGRYLFS
jgi:transposase